MTINFEFKFKEVYDKDTKNFVVVCKRYGVSGYGRTKKKAYRMSKFIINEILKP